MTIGVIVLVLIAIEQSLRFMFFSFKHAHPILENETNRQILARHIGIDTVCCMVVAYLGMKNTHVCQDIISHVLHGKNSMPLAGFEKRLFTYFPASQQIALVFFAYQVKNMYDTIVWNDGIEFVLHHIFAGAAAYGAMYPGVAHFYAVFFLGISEISTAILCVLANFDDTHGVEGLAEAFPTARIVIAVSFVIAFICCRTVMWPFFGYHFMRDALAALKSNHSWARKAYLRMLLTIFGGLTLLQIIWLGQIIVMARQEILKLI
jgi:hypothetical protein